jgi:hypothetical protein
MQFMRLMQRAAQTDEVVQPRHARRDPSHELYDQACELLLAAQGLRVAAGTRGSAPAIAATVGCLDATLEALADAVAAMRGEAAREVSRAEASMPGAADTGREFSELAAAIGSAHEAAGRMRERVGPVLARLTLP